MNDFERRLRDLGDKAREDASAPVRPRPAALRRIRRRRAALSTGALACVATIVTVGAFAWAAREPREQAPPPAGESNLLEIVTKCGDPAFEPAYVPEGYATAWGLPSDEDRPGVIGALYRGKAHAVELTMTPGDWVQTRPRPIEVLGARATIGTIHEGWSVEFRYRDCDYALLGYGIGRGQLERVAEGLEPRATVTSAPDGGDQGLSLVWPEDTFERAEEGCNEASPGERTAPQVVSRFATEVLGWESPIYAPPPTRSDAWTVRPSAPDTYGGNVSAGVSVWTTEILPGCWSITSLSRLPDRRPTGVGVSVSGRAVSIGYDPLGATSATIEIGYGGRDRKVFDRAPLDVVEVKLGYDPDTTGHFLVLLRDEAGQVFTAYGSALPAGDFAAG